MKSWLAHGSSGRRVTLLSGTTFLHINGALAATFARLNRAVASMRQNEAVASS